MSIDLHLLGLPVRTDPDMPPGILRLVSNDGHEVMTGISVKWVYQALSKLGTKPFDPDRRWEYWVVRDITDITAQLEREGVKAP